MKKMKMMMNDSPFSPFFSLLVMKKMNYDDDDDDDEYDEVLRFYFDVFYCFDDEDGDVKDSAAIYDDDEPLSSSHAWKMKMNSVDIRVAVAVEDEDELY
ncbi:probable GTP-binding protein OBGC1, chloroplastic [Papaver somniferum]|uniref:probable GTP-binding protein OBGC1, chloroplastic n=1 Tax=Papaver somniferum TaxID=3469 RepID=UPI000E6FB039|nr:probable GTP-binding protein OBGC1, chloroplastic [Papaver somniferum]